MSIAYKVDAIVASASRALWEGASGTDDVDGVKWCGESTVE